MLVIHKTLVDRLDYDRDAEQNRDAGDLVAVLFEVGAWEERVQPFYSVGDRKHQH